MKDRVKVRGIALIAAFLAGCVLSAAISAALAATLGVAHLTFLPTISSLSPLSCTCVHNLVTVEMPILPTSPKLTLMAVQANTSWQDTGIIVARGETVKIIYLCGRWCPWTGFCLDGRGCLNVDSAVCSPNPDDPANLISALHASLIARIGENPAFPVGNGLTFQAAHSGRLQLRINDVRVEDNSGAIVVLLVTGACAADNP